MIRLGDKNIMFSLDMLSMKAFKGNETSNIHTVAIFFH